MHVRFGGPLGQVAMISRHKNVQEIGHQAQVIEDSANGKIPSSTAPSDVGRASG
ncbi:MAG: hypothetical protein R3D46_16280 [Defluviimonas denitrificans]